MRISDWSSDVCSSDLDWTLWQHYGIEAWPTVVLIDGEGNIRERWVGDGQVRELDAAVTSLNNAIVPRSRNAAPIALRSMREPMLPLSFPVGIAVDANYLYVADSRSEEHTSELQS